MLALLIVSALLLLEPLTTQQRPHKQLNTIPSDWVEYSPGSCNVIISSPHGGAVRAPEISERTHGCLAADGVTCRWEKGCEPADSNACRAVTGTDSYTQQVAALIVQHLSDRHGCRPHFIRSNLHRSRLDPNRPIEEAAQGDPLAQAAWRAYHESYMTTAVETVRARFGRGLVFDIHGQSHPEQWTEMGYVLSKAELNAGPTHLTGSSIRGLGARSRLSARELLSGRLSFGAFLESAGYKTVPSTEYPSPGAGNYFSGGYITQRYGSRTDGGQVDAIQVEIASGLRLNATSRVQLAADLARVISDFRLVHSYNVAVAKEN